MMPGVDAAAGTLAVPIWLAGAGVAVSVMDLLAAERAGGVALITSLFRVGLIAAAVLGAWLYAQLVDVAAKDPNPDSERRALDDRKTALMAASIAPGSALSCLDELAGEAVESACEKAVFASPESVASAVKYVVAQIELLNDGTAYAGRGELLPRLNHRSAAAAGGPALVTLPSLFVQQEIPLRAPVGSPSRASPVDDRRKRQTFAATPAEPGDPPAPSEVALEIRRRVLADQDQRFDDRRPAAHRQRTADIRPGGEPNGASGSRRRP
jgi:hypothetical protein